MAYLKRIGDKKYFIRVSSGTGAGRMQKSRTFRGTRKAAEKWASEFEQKLDAGYTVEEITLTLNDYLDKWLTKVAKQRVRTRTYGSYKEMLARYFRPTIGAIKLSELKTHHVQDVYDSMTDNGLSPRTVGYAHTILKSALNDGVDKEYLQKNPCLKAHVPKQERKEMVVLDEAEARRLLEVCQNEPNGLIFELALETGLRPGEYLSLKWPDIDFANQTISVQRSIAFKSGGGYEFTPPKTNKSRRSVPFTDSLRTRLIEHKRIQNEIRLRERVYDSSIDLVFATRIGSPIRIENLRTRYLKSVLEGAEIKKHVTPKTLRHTCATLLLKAGEKSKVVQERLGHENISTTLNIYSHVLPGMQEQATDRLDNLLRMGAK